VLRYGRMVAASVAERADVSVVQAHAGAREASLTELRRAAGRLRRADVVHLQWKLAEWGGPVAALPRLEVVLAATRRPTVVTLHDVYPRAGFRERWTEPGALAIRRLALGGHRMIVHSLEERRRLAGLVPERLSTVIPHFVEERAPGQSREAAKRALGLDGRRVISLVGFMTRRKGHRLVLEAMTALPPDVAAVFAGAPIEGREARGEELEACARELGVADRVLFTGYVPDAMLATILAATDVALCPYRDMSASGSLSTWISTGRPIVASDLPALREYDALVPGSLRLFSPLTADALAAAVERVLAEPPADVDASVDRLRTLLALPRIAASYVDAYRAAMR
jgi:glycosyltransferase involved in cell wall biosynthesis